MIKIVLETCAAFGGISCQVRWTSTFPEAMSEVFLNFFGIMFGFPTKSLRV